MKLKDTIDINTKHFKFNGFDKEMKPVFVPKKSYPNEIEAQVFCFNKNLKPYSIHKLVAYKCPICGQYHTGHNNTLLTTRERLKIQKQYEKFKIIHGLNKN